MVLHKKKKRRRLSKEMRGVKIWDKISVGQAFRSANRTKVRGTTGKAKGVWGKYLEEDGWQQ